VTARDFPRVGIRSAGVALLPAQEARRTLGTLEELGYRAFWFSEGAKSKDALVYASLLLALSERLIVAAGIASIYARDPFAMRTGSAALAEAYPGRFVLGLGVSHAPLVERRGHVYLSPLTAMREYLDAMEQTEYAGAAPATPAPVLLGALNPKMLALAAERTNGAHPYFVPVEHTRRARKILGPMSFLAPDQAVVLDADPARARATAREFAQAMLRFPNYRASLGRLGYSEGELTAPIAERVVEDIVATGDAETIAKRVGEHLAAGADHVSLQVLTPGRADVPMDELRALAPLLTGSFSPDV
jgi:probable F420-dependent oxidoreductase